MDGTLEEIRRRQADRRAAYQARYDGHVRLMADGQKADTDEVEQTLEAVGKTAEEMARDVSRRVERVGLAREANRGSQLNHEAAEARRKLAAESQRIDEARIKFFTEANESLAPLQASFDSLTAESRSAVEARRKLKELFMADLRREAGGRGNTVIAEDAHIGQEVDASNKVAQYLEAVEAEDAAIAAAGGGTVLAAPGDSVGVVAATGGVLPATVVATRGTVADLDVETPGGTIRMTSVQYDPTGTRVETWHPLADGSPATSSPAPKASDQGVSMPLDHWVINKTRR